MCIFGLLNVQQKHEHVIVKQIKLMKAISSNTHTLDADPKPNQNEAKIETM